MMVEKRPDGFLLSRAEGVEAEVGVKGNGKRHVGSNPLPHCHSDFLAENYHRFLLDNFSRRRL